MFKSDILKELSDCGFIKDVAKERKLDEILSTKKITLYCGFDLTAKSLHVGNLMQIMLLRKFLKFGHKAIFLLGGGTTKIGDPTGKDDVRKILTDEEIEKNKEGIESNFAQFIDIQSPNVLILNNLDWLSKFSYIEFLREVGMHFTVNRMLTMESVRQRLEKQNPMSFIEFNYMLMQGYDFAYLNKHHDCILQVGGSDQWGNITEGMELCTRMNKAEGFALTSPLITRSDGQKMGKSLDGAISLSPAITSSFEYFQYFRNMPDDDVIKMLKIYTDVPLEEISALEKLKGKEINKAKEILAFEATKLCRGEAEAKKAMEEANRIFTQGQAPETEELIISAKINETILRALVNAQVISSISEGKRLCSGGGIKVDNFDIIEDADGFVGNFNEVNSGKFNITSEAKFINSGEIRIYIGKKKIYKIIVN